MPVRSSPAKQLRRSKFIRWSLGLLALMAVGSWYFGRPDPKAHEREALCKSWGISDPATLANCRSSAALEAQAIAPYKRAAVQREIAAFNEDLAAAAKGKAMASDTGLYQVESISDAAKEAGGVFGMVFPRSGEKVATSGRRIKLRGLIVTQIPDPDDEPGEKTWEPRYFTLDEETHNPKEMPASVNLDIESLNRYERQFIIDHCAFLSVTPCRATVFGHIGEIVGRRADGVTYVGVIADQVDVEPLDWGRANPDGIPSTWLLQDLANGSRPHPSGQ